MLDLQQGWIRQIIGATSSKRSLQPIGCKGHFFDIARKRIILIDLGYVSVRCPFSFRAVPSSVVRLLAHQSGASGLSWVEGAALNEYISECLKSSIQELPAHASAFFDEGFPNLGNSELFQSCSVSTTATNSHKYHV